MDRPTRRHQSPSMAHTIRPHHRSDDLARANAPRRRSSWSPPASNTSFQISSRTPDSRQGSAGLSARSRSVAIRSFLPSLEPRRDQRETVPSTFNDKRLPQPNSLQQRQHHRLVVERRLDLSCNSPNPSNRQPATALAEPTILRVLTPMRS